MDLTFLSLFSPTPPTLYDQYLDECVNSYVYEVDNVIQNHRSLADEAFRAGNNYTGDVEIAKALGWTVGGAIPAGFGDFLFSGWRYYHGCPEEAQRRVDQQKVLSDQLPPQLSSD